MTNNLLKIIFILLLGLGLGARPVEAQPAKKINRVLQNAKYQTQITQYYDPAYVQLPYPQGDVPLERGVCTDVVIRAFREVGVDLQVLVHRDMKKNFQKYPKIWGLKAPDPNIDHRRVPNLMTFFKRQGKSLSITQQAQNYHAGDVVAWQLPNGRQHIGIVIDEKTPKQSHPLVIHNIGFGTQKEDILFQYKIIGHYRYF